MVCRLAFARGLSRKSNLGKSTNVRSKRAARKMAPAVAFLTPVIMAGYISSAGNLASVKPYFVLAPERRLPPESDSATAGALRSSSRDSESRYDSESGRTRLNQVGLTRPSCQGAAINAA